MTPEAVTELRARYANGESAPSLARVFGIPRSRAWRIATGRSRQAGHVRGEVHPRARLTERDVLSIRARHSQGESVAALAVEFGVSPGAIWFVVQRRNWAWLRDDVEAEAAA